MTNDTTQRDSTASTTNQSNLSPCRITFRGDTLVCSTSIKVPQGEPSQGQFQWKKFSITCSTPKELWDTIHAIHAQGAQALAEQSQGPNFGLAQSNVIEVDFDYVAHKVHQFLSKGGTIKRCSAGESAFSTSAINIQSLMDELDKIPNALPAELQATQSAEQPHKLEETDTITKDDDFTGAYANPESYTGAVATY